MGNYLDGYGKDICKHCKKTRTIEGYDGCIGFLPNVMNACCGHGEDKVAHVQFNHKGYSKESNKHRIKGDEAIKYINDNKIIMKITKTLRLEPELIKQIEDLAAKENRNFSNMIETILNRFFIKQLKLGKQKPLAKNKDCEDDFCHCIIPSPDKGYYCFKCDRKIV